MTSGGTKADWAFGSLIRGALDIVDIAQALVREPTRSRPPLTAGRMQVELRFGRLVVKMVGPKG